ncbi:hypothetical protein DM860_003387 [Cuscuta australis]|uniref:HAT C-terminal dimerisation domain-containing protein n=1 Tax=Cuscuta australis TaxID=267555 RepID=A0A328DJ18_9ASTE|nr:hypothetical protein DM860_003387 [Cuscuta australis]
MSRESGRRSVDMGVVNRSLSKDKAKGTSDGSTSHGSRGRHSVSSFRTIPNQFIGDGMTDEEFDQIYSGRGDANLPALDSLFEDVDEAGLDNMDGDGEPTPHSNEVDVETETKDGVVYGTCNYCVSVIKMGVSGGYGGPEKHLRSRHPVEYAKYAAKKKGRQEVQTQIPQNIKGYTVLYQKKQHLLRLPNKKKSFKGIVSALFAKKGKLAQPSTSSCGTTVSSHNELAMYQGVPCDYDEDDVEFDVLGWWKRNEHMFPCLGKLARQVLSVPVSTVAVERKFSAGGNILTDFRSCLNAESLETLVCNQDWLFARRRAQESGFFAGPLVSTACLPFVAFLSSHNNTKPSAFITVHLPHYQRPPSSASSVCDVAALHFKSPLTSGPLSTHFCARF